MYQRLSVFLLTIGVWLFTPNVCAEEINASAETYYERGLEASQRLQQLLASPNKDADNELQATLETVSSNLERASRLGHPVASFYWAQLLINKRTIDSSSNQENYERGCALLTATASQGLLAAAVVNFYQCDKAYMRFQFDDPSHLAVLALLEQALDKPDPAIAYYPLPITSSQCFLAPGGDTARSQPLTREQLRAEAEYILGSTREPQDREGLEQSLHWLDRAAAHGCLSSLDLRPAIHKKLAKE